MQIPDHFSVQINSISDFEGNKKEFSGHKTDSQVAVYDRKIKVVPTVDKTLPELSDFPNMDL